MFLKAAIVGNLQAQMKAEVTRVAGALRRAEDLRNRGV
jgi:hypothetical protein